MGKTYMIIRASTEARYSRYIEYKRELSWKTVNYHKQESMRTMSYQVQPKHCCTRDLPQMDHIHSQF